MSFGEKICMFWVHGRCQFSDERCRHSHRKEDAPLCKRWVQGICIGNAGNACRFRHFYGSSDTIAKPTLLFQDENKDAPSNSLTDFSSPLIVRVKKFTESKRVVESDLETGINKSFVITEEKEMIDLCGSPTPVKKKLKENPKKIEDGSSTCNDCNKEFKNKRGLSVHKRYCTAKSSKPVTSVQPLSDSTNRLKTVFTVNKQPSSPVLSSQRLDDSVILID